MGTKGLLTVFFGLAVVCGLFFAFGYTIGHHTIPATFTLGSAPPVVNKAAAPTAAPGVQPPNAAQLGAAESNQTPATLSNNPPPGAGDGTAAGPVEPGAAAGGDAKTAANAAGATAGEPTAQPKVNANGAFQVFVFSGSQNDANLLAAALQAKNYPALVVSPAANSVDGLFRVEVGPYMTRPEADAIRSRLAADGYQATITQ